MRVVVALAGGLAPRLALAADAPVAGDGAGLVRATLGLALVLGLIFAVGWAMRRISPARSAAGPLRIVGAQALGARERVVLVEVGDQWLVLGVAPGNVRGLATLPRGTLPAAPSSPVAGFANLLARARGGAGAAGAAGAAAGSVPGDTPR